jgi:hypothetical protein
LDVMSSRCFTVRDLCEGHSARHPRVRMQPAAGSSTAVGGQRPLRVKRSSARGSTPARARLAPATEGPATGRAPAPVSAGDVGGQGRPRSTAATSPCDPVRLFSPLTITNVGRCSLSPKQWGRLRRSTGGWWCAGAVRAGSRGYGPVRTPTDDRREKCTGFCGCAGGPNTSATLCRFVTLCAPRCIKKSLNYRWCGSSTRTR